MRFFFIVFLVPSLFLIAGPGFGSAVSFSDSSKTAFKTTTGDPLEKLTQLAKQEIGKKDFHRAKSTIAQALEYAEKNNLKIPYQLYWAQTDLALYNRDIDEAYVNIKKVCDLLKNSKSLSEYATAMNYRANIMLQMGKFKNSIETYQENILYIKKNQLKGLLPNTYRELAVTYRYAGTRDEEKKWIEMMLQASLEENDSLNQARANFLLADIAFQVDSNFQLAREHFMESLKIRENMKDSASFPVILGKISWTLYKMNLLDSSLKYYNKMAKISEIRKNYPFLANALANIGTIYRDKKENGQALFYYGKSTAYSLMAKDWSTLSWMNQDMSEMYRQSGDFKKAYECYVAYKNYSDSVQSQKYNLGLADARIRYEAESKAKNLEVLTLKLENQKFFIFALSGGILLIIFTGVFLFRQSRLNDKRRISEMNQKIAEITQANLRQQMNPHFIFNTLNSIQYYMYQHDKIATNNYLTKFSSLMRKTLENSQHTSVSIKDELDALQLYLELETIRFKEKFDYVIHVDEEIDTLMYKIPTMLIQPYVENAIGHGLVNREDKGLLQIDLKLMNDHIFCTVEDNGIGREAAMEIKKNRENNHHSLGTRITESRLQLVNSLYGTGMKIKYTDLKDENGSPSGTRVEIQIPIMT